MELLYQYISATTNLYGIIHKRKVREIYNQQNEEKLSLEAYQVFISEYMLNKSSVVSKGEYFVSIAAVLDDEKILENQEGKPYYIPSREDLLKYEDPDYFEVNEAYEDLLRFLKTRFFRKSKAEVFAKEIQSSCRHLEKFHESMAYYWGIRNFNIRNELKAREFLYLLDKLRMNTRAFELKGHTAVELFDIVGKKEIERLINDGVD